MSASVIQVMSSAGTELIVKVIKSGYTAVHHFVFWHFGLNGERLGPLSDFTAILGSIRLSVLGTTLYQIESEEKCATGKQTIKS